MRVAIYGLIYGDYHAMHRRFVNSLKAALPEDKLEDESIKVTIWGNQPCDETDSMMRDIPEFIWSPTSSNIPKYKLMREQLFTITNPDDYDWMVWFDDDSWISRPDVWWNTMMEVIRTRAKQNVCYIGECWFWCWKPGQWKSVEEAKWFKGVPARIDHRKRPAVEFAQGGLWWLRSDVRKLLDWPDPRLSHNGGDVLLGEAIRQQGLPFHKVHSKIGFLSNNAVRRGYREKPLGAN